MFAASIGFTIYKFHKKTYHEANRNWKKKTLAERGLDEHGIKLNALVETEQPLNAPAPETETKANLNEREKESLADIARQIEMAMASDETPQGVKDCLYSIIFEASNEAGLPLGDMSLVRAAFPNIIENLNYDYGRGVYHSIHAILIQDTTAFRDFYDQRFDEKPDGLPELAKHISAAMKNPLIPTELFNIMADALSTVPKDWRTPEAILTNLQELQEREAENE
jgi:hypothetical protein